MYALVRVSLDNISPPVLIAISLGFVMPWLLGYLWDDAIGSFIWGGLVSRLASAYTPRLVV